MRTLAIVLCTFFLSTILTAQNSNWIQVASLETEGRHHPVTFGLDGYGYMLTGTSSSMNETKDFHRYNPKTDSWEELPDFPGPARSFAYGVEEGGKGYMGFGSGRNDLWTYDPDSAAWTQLADCPCAERSHPAFLSLPGKIYVGMGGGNRSDWWEYDMATDSWEQKANFPSTGRHHPYYFSIDTLVYVGFGHGSDPIDGKTIYKDMYSYNPSTDTWTEIAEFPDQGRVAGTQFSYGGKGYLLSGDGDDHGTIATGEFWEYDPIADTWTALPPHPGNSLWAPGSFVLGDTVYFVGGYHNIDAVYPDAVWMYNMNPAPASAAFVISQSITLDDATGDGDQEADYGETILLNVDLVNTGLQVAENVQVTLNVNDPAITITDGVEDWGTIMDTSSLLKLGAFAFDVVDDAVNGHRVDFLMQITYNDSLSYDVPFKVTIQAPAFDIANVLIDDQAQGNGNGRMDSGETVTIRVKTLNTGMSTAPSAMANLTSNSPWLNLVEDFNVGVLDAQGEIWADFEAVVSMDAPNGVAADFEYIVAGGTYERTTSFRRFINAVMEDFETDDFTAFPWETNVVRPWTITQTDVYEGASCAVSGNIGSNQTSNMKLTLDFETGGEVIFARKVSSEATYDFLKFYIDNSLQEQWSGEMDWEEVSYLVGPGLHTLWWAYTKDQIVDEGEDKAWVDGIILPELAETSANQNISIQGFTAQINPNPASNVAFLNMQLDVSKTLDFQLVNTLGQVVRTYPTAELGAGTTQQKINLDGLAPDVYFLQIKSGQKIEVVRFVKQ